MLRVITIVTCLSLTAATLAVPPQGVDTEPDYQALLDPMFEAETVRISGQVRSNTVIRAASLKVELTPETGHLLEVVFGEVDAPVPEETADEGEVEAAMAAAAAAAIVKEGVDELKPTGVNKKSKRGGKKKN